MDMKYFTPIRNDLITNNDLSLGAKGLYCLICYDLTVSLKKLLLNPKTKETKRFRKIRRWNMTVDETLKLIAQQWCNLADLMKLANIGRNSALAIKSKIKNDLESKGYYVPKNAVPMQEVVKYLNIDIDYLESRSKNMKGDVKLA